MAEKEIQTQANQMQPIVDEKKFHRLDSKKKPLYIGIVALVLVVAVPALMFLYYTVALDRPAQCTEEKVFVIEKGEGVASISQRLYDESLINSRILFNFYTVVNNLQSKLQAGTYRIPAGCSVKNLSALFMLGRDDLKVTFLEGWRVEEYARVASVELANIGYDTFIEEAKEYEGSLFPDTYEFNADADEDAVINAMRENFTTKTSDVLTNEALSRVGLSNEQVLIFASIVEREVVTEADRRIVAGILVKRFKEGGLIGADATAQYAVAPKGEPGKEVWWPKELTAEDLASESPYNTRKVAGLPPTPICSPGLGAIRAVLELQETKNYYYLTDQAGVTHYAVTLDEHNRNIAKYL
jgi:UPF0755 protein